MEYIRNQFCLDTNIDGDTYYEKKSYLSAENYEKKVIFYPRNDSQKLTGEKFSISIKYNEYGKSIGWKSDTAGVTDWLYRPNGLVDLKDLFAWLYDLGNYAILKDKFIEGHLRAYSSIGIMDPAGNMKGVFEYTKKMIKENRAGYNSILYGESIQKDGKDLFEFAWVSQKDREKVMEHGFQKFHPSYYTYVGGCASRPNFYPIILENGNHLDILSLTNRNVFGKFSSIANFDKSIQEYPFIVENEIKDNNEIDSSEM